MATEIDNRVVQMTFNNKSFESGVDKTLNTLDKLKKALKFDDASKGFDEIQDNADKVDFKQLSNNISTLTERFSGLGIIGMRIWSRIGDAAIDLVTGPFKKIEQTISSLTSQAENMIVQGGWNRALNLEKAEFMLRNLGHGWDTAKDAAGNYVEYTINKNDEKVKNAYKAIAESVDGTAFSLDQAASAAANFLASGVDAGEELYDSLRAVQGMSSVFGTEFSQVAGYFQQIASGGAVTKGIVTYMTQTMGAPVKELLKKGLGLTADELDAALEDGLISFEMFRDVMLNEFGDSLDEANNSFTGVTSNVKSAFSRIGAAVAEPLIKKAIPALNTLRLFINKINATLNESGVYEFINNILARGIDLLEGMIKPLTEADAELTSLKNVATGFVNIANGLGHIFKAAEIGFLRVFGGPAQKNLNNFSTSFLNFSKSFYNFTTANPNGGQFVKLIDVFQAIANVLKVVGSVVKVLLKIIGVAVKTAIKIGAALAYAAAKFINFTASIVKAIKESKTFKLITSTLQKAFTSLKKKVSDVTSTFANFVKTHAKVNKAVDAIKNAFTFLDDTFYNALTSLGKFYNKVIDFVSDANIFETLGDIWSSAFDKIKTAISAVIDKFEEWTGIELNIPSLDDIKEKLDNVKQAVIDAFSDPHGTADAFYNKLVEIKDFLTNSFITTLDTVNDKFKDFKNWLAAFGGDESALSDVTGSTEELANIESNLSLLERIGQQFDSFATLISDAWDKLKEIGNALVNGISWAFTEILEYLDIHSLSDFIDVLKDLIGLVIKYDWAKAGLGIGQFFSSLSGVLNQSLGKNSAKKIETIGNSILKIGISLGLIAGSLYAISQLNTEEIAQAEAAMLTMVIMVAILVKVIERIGKMSGKLDAGGVSTKIKDSIAERTKNAIVNKFGSAAQLAATGLLIGSISAGLLTMIGGFILLYKALQDGEGNINTKALVASMGVMIVLIVAVSLMVKLLLNAVGESQKEWLDEKTNTLQHLNKGGAEGGPITALAAFMVTFSNAILKLVAATAILGALYNADDGDTLEAGLVALLVITAILGGLMAVVVACTKNINDEGLERIVKKDSSGGPIAALAAFLIAFSAAVFLLLPSIAILGAMDAGVFWQGIAGVLIIAGAIAIITLAAGKLGNNGGLETFGVLLVAVLGLWLIIKALTDLVTAVDGDSDILANIGWVITAILFFVGGLFYLTSKTKKIEKEAIITLAVLILGFIAIAETLKDLASVEIADVGSFIKILIAVAAIIVGITFLGGLANIIPGIKTGLTALGIGFLGIGAGIFLFAAAVALLTPLIDKIYEQKDSLHDKIVAFCDLIAQAVVGILTGIVRLLGLGAADFIKDLADLLLAVIVGIADWLFDNKYVIADAITKLVEALVAIIVGAIAGIVSGLIGGIVDGLASALDGIKGLITGIKDDTNDAKDAQIAALQSANDELAKENNKLRLLLNKEENAKKPDDQRVYGTIRGKTFYYSDYTKWMQLTQGKGSTTSEDFYQWLIGGKKENDKILDKYVKQTTANAGSAYGTIYRDAAHQLKLVQDKENPKIMHATFQGVEKAFDATKAEYGYLMAAYSKADYDKVKEYMGIHSPSKLYQQLGKYVVLGYNKGLEDNFDSTTSIIGAYFRSIENATDDFTITPVFNLGEIQNGAKNLTATVGSFGPIKQEVDLLNQTNTNKIDNLSRVVDSLAATSNTQSLEEKISAQNDIIANLSSKLDGMSVYLDSKALVGGITNKVDKALGFKAGLVGRSAKA